MWIQLRNGELGKKVGVALRLLSDGSRFVPPKNFTATGEASDIFTYKITSDGGFGEGRVRITVKYDGDPFKFSPPLTITFK